FPQVQFQVADAARLPFEAHFDAIFSNAAIHWVLDYRGAIDSMYRALRSGGRMVVEFGGKGNIEAILQALRSTLRNKGHIEQAERQQWFFPSIGQYTQALEERGFEVEWAHLFKRPTLLADQQKGIQDWLLMFAKGIMAGIPAAEQQIIIMEVQEKLRPQLFYDENWWADYKRIRIKAVKP
ncbi:MAG: methyltransferase domain-containing protein, partial [Bacteroidota bacterium]